MEGESTHVTEYIQCSLPRAEASFRKTENSLRMPIGVEKRVVVTIWKLATNVEYQTILAFFSLGRSTVCVIVGQTCNAIAKHLFPLCLFLRENGLGTLCLCLRRAGDFLRWPGLLMGCIYVSQQECFRLL